MSDQHQLVRYKSGKIQFEVLVKPGTVPKYREGKLGIDNVLFSDIIFKKYSKAEKATPTELK
jgi:ribosome maturation protein Sdo1